METENYILGMPPENEHIENYLVTSSSDDSQDSDQSNLQVGLLKESIKLLRDKLIAEPNSSACNLLIGEIPLRAKSDTYKGKLFGQTEGLIENYSDVQINMASKAIIFMVISLTENWKIIVGLFFVHNPDITSVASAVEEALIKLHENGVEILSITLNCINVHLSFALAEELGAKIDLSRPTETFKPHFKHPNSQNLVHIFFDMDSILVFLKTYWATKRVLRYKGLNLHYYLCQKARKVQEADLQHFPPEKLYDWFIIKKRLCYDPDILGRTTANAIEYLKDLNIKSFNMAEPTVQFLRVLDSISFISKIDGQDNGNLISASNKKKWMTLILDILSYIKDLDCINCKLPESENPVAFSTCVAGITIYFTSLFNMFPKYKNADKDLTDVKKNLPFLLPARFRLKHIRIGLFEDMHNQNITALSVFKKVKNHTRNCQKIDP